MGKNFFEIYDIAKYSAMIKKKQYYLSLRDGNRERVETLRKEIFDIGDFSYLQAFAPSPQGVSILTKISVAYYLVQEELKLGGNRGVERKGGQCPFWTIKKYISKWRIWIGFSGMLWLWRE